MYFAAAGLPVGFYTRGKRATLVAEAGEQQVPCSLTRSPLLLKINPCSCSCSHERANGVSNSSATPHCPQTRIAIEAFALAWGLHL
ncbi:hypothetical protein GOP47_0007648 [Adiantum capillus-veneris]|uniref:Uncharacterized protein n=1 Tax=Adiantum capillus-veneris TaxID=13818 RepID=A0A9D4V1F7_ADICA|nr:hypothetical protein GOP47_0007648 [Adiantum capillus-veneris]